MSACPKPDKITQLTHSSPTTIVATPSSPVTESCNANTITTTVAGGGTHTITYIQGPAGPQGPAGAPASCAPGFNWKGKWVVGQSYFTHDDTAPVCNSDVVEHNGSTYVCIQLNTSVKDVMGPGTYFWSDPVIVTPGNEPGTDAGGLYWNLSAGVGKDGSLTGADKGIFDSFFDWIKDMPNWGLTDWLKLIAGGAAAIWTGTKLISAMTSSGSNSNAGGSFEAGSQKFTGSAGYAGSYTQPTLQQVLTDLLLRSGLTSGQFDVTGVSNQTVEGTLTNRPSASSTLQQLAQVYQLTWTNTGGVMKFSDRASTSVATLSDAEFSYTDNPEAIPSPWQQKRLQGVELPKKVYVDYISRALQYNQFSQESPELDSYPDGQEVTISVPWILTPTQAKKAADDILIQPHLERTTSTISTTYKYAYLEPGDVINTAKGYKRIIEIQESREGILDFVFTDAGIPSAPVPVYAGPVIIGYTAGDYVGSNQPPTPEPTLTNTVKDIGYSNVFVIDVPPLFVNDDKPRCYIGVHGYGNANWPGATVHVSDNNGSTYKPITTSSRSCTFGMVETPIGAPPYEGLVWDDLNTIDVEIKYGVLQSRDDFDVINGENTCMIGHEMIGYGTATLTGVSANGNNVYRLSHLLRGRQGTDWVYSEYYGSHVAHELFILIDDSLIRFDIDLAQRGVTRRYKAVTLGSTLELTDYEDYAVLSTNLVPWRVAQPTSSQANGEFTINWTERPRWNGDGLDDFVEVSKDSDWAGWSIAIIDNTNTTELRKATITSPQFVYTLVMQGEDFGVQQVSCPNVRIAAMSRFTGSGYTRDYNA